MIYRIRCLLQAKMESGGVEMDKKEKTVIPEPEIPADPFGSYTGVPAQRFEKPVQDADDL